MGVRVCDQACTFSTLNKHKQSEAGGARTEEAFVAVVVARTHTPGFDGVIFGH